MSMLFIRCANPESTIEENDTPSKLTELKANNEPFEELISIENAKQKIIKSGKHGLIYFGAKIDVNSQKMENEILKDMEILNVLKENFTLFKAYVDEDMVVTEDGVQKTGKYGDIMENIFNNVYTPYFVIIDSEGAKVADLVAHPKKRDEFLEFIKR